MHRGSIELAIAARLARKVHPRCLITQLSSLVGEFCVMVSQVNMLVWCASSNVHLYLS